MVSCEDSGMTRTLETKIQAGMDLLNKVRPGWINQVDLRLLDMGGSPYQCILGQLYGDYEVAVELLDLSVAKAIKHGFELRILSGPGCTALENAWKEAILKARGEQS